ncbi:MAG: AhpC/TSA family protein [Bdellovibrionales bacterium]|nr:AhpC/TSA family protein [Bdellovibrionales bacterium]
MSLFKTQAALRVKFAKMLNPVNNAVINNHNELLRADGSLEKVTKVGDKAPSFSLKNGGGAIVSSEDLLKSGPLVVIFNRGTWCPYCNEEARAFNERLGDFNKLKVNVVILSPQKLGLAQKQQTDFKLGYNVLVDQENEIGRAFGVVYEFTDELRKLYVEQFKNDVSQHNESLNWELPFPARIVIGTDGIVKDVLVEPDYRFSAEVEDTIEAIRTTC